LIAGKGGKPSQVNLRRALSSAYYAMFHSLARTSADLLVGGDGAERSKHAWKQVYRAIDHGTTKNACLNGSIITKFPKSIEDFANTFVTMQNKRHAADYDPEARFTKSDVQQDIIVVRKTITAFNGASRKDRLAFCAYVLFKKRS
jgi:uncharacterized protein (UPF0332 family)